MQCSAMKHSSAIAKTCALIWPIPFLPHFNVYFWPNFWLMIKNLGVWFLIVLFFSSCTINRNIMFRDTKDFEFEVPYDTFGKDYVLAPNDKISFRLYTKDGLQLIDPTFLERGTSVQAQRFLTEGITFLIESDGRVNMPLLGRIPITGKNLVEAERYLEDLYADYFNNPYAVLDIINNRVIVSPGGGGTAQVINLVNNNTTVMEILAMAGGITDEGNAKEIKLIRKKGDERLVYKMDLSTLEGLEMADMIVQANDIVYVQPVRNYAREAIVELGPYLSLISSILLILSIINNNR